MIELMRAAWNYLFLWWNYLFYGGKPTHFGKPQRISHTAAEVAHMQEMMWAA
jgi:hypothetical protein